LTSHEDEDPNATCLLTVLSSNMRHWCMYEWFYSTLDRDFFNENEFRACLRLMGLDHVSTPIVVRTVVGHRHSRCDGFAHVGVHQLTHLTRTEWSAVRSVISSEIGKPRRFSRAFLKVLNARGVMHVRNGGTRM
jgi:hypothetical protein